LKRRGQNAKEIFFQNDPFVKSKEASDKADGSVAYLETSDKNANSRIGVNNASSTSGVGFQ